MKESEGIMIFKDTMEYLINGEINEMQYAYLTKLIYETRWGNGVDESTIEDRDVRMIWKTLKHSIRKSKDNAKQYAKAKLKKEAEISPNKPDFYSDDTEVPQEAKSVSEGPIQGEFDNIELKEEDMGTFIGTLNNYAVETRRIEHEEEMPMDNMLKCLSVFDINKAKHQVFKSRTIDENMKRVADCLDPLLGGFSKTDRSRLYISIIEDVLKSN